MFHLLSFKPEAKPSLQLRATTYRGFRSLDTCLANFKSLHALRQGSHSFDDLSAAALIDLELETVSYKTKIERFGSYCAVGQHNSLKITPSSMTVQLLDTLLLFRTQWSFQRSIPS